MMRKWYVPITVLGLSGLGILLMTDSGRSVLRWMRDHIHERALLEWNEAAQRELDRIQEALNRVAASLNAAHERRPVAM